MKFLSPTTATLGVAFLLARTATAAPQHPVECVSVSSTGVSADGDSYYASISYDGRYVAFTSDATNLVTGDTNGVPDVFRKDRLTGAVVLASVGMGGAEADDESYTSYATAISADGRYVVFTSDATNLVPNDTNGADDVFVRDLVAGTTIRVSVGPGGLEGDGDSEIASISADGNRVIFESGATNLLAQPSAPGQVYVHDVAGRSTRMVSVDSSGDPGNGHSSYAAISGDGEVAVFLSTSNNLGAGVPPQFIAYDFYVHDLGTGVTRSGVTSPAVISGGEFAGYATISYDGTRVAFTSTASDLVPGDTNGLPDAFVIDLSTDAIQRVSVGSGPGGALFDFPKISPDGRTVGFMSEARDLVPGDSNGQADAFVRDLLAEATIRSSVAADGTQGTVVAGPLFASIARGLSEDGRYVLFASSFDGLVAGDHNARNDIFVQDRGALAPGRYCQAKADSEGCAPSMGFAGIPSASAASVFEIRAEPIPDGRLGILLYGFGPSHTPFAGGVRCVAPPLRRAGVAHSAGGTGAPCSAALSVDFNERIRSGADPALVPGTVVYAQYVYRDRADPSGAGLGMSDALRFVIQP